MPPAAAREEQDMETITNLIKDTPIPKMVKVRQNFDKTYTLGSFISSVCIFVLALIGALVIPLQAYPAP